MKLETSMPCMWLIRNFSLIFRSKLVGVLNIPCYPNVKKEPYIEKIKISTLRMKLDRGKNNLVQKKNIRSLKGLIPFPATWTKCKWWNNNRTLFPRENWPLNFMVLSFILLHAIKKNPDQLEDSLGTFLWSI